LLLTFTAGLTSVGCFMFATSHSLEVAEFSRFVMGFGAAFAFVGTLKLVTLWFDSAHFGLLAGLTQALGMLGAAVGEGPLSYLVTGLGWRQTMMLVGAVLFTLAILIGIFVRNKPQYRVRKQRVNSDASLLKSLYIVVKNKHSWLNAVAIGFLYAPTAAFAELWGVSYLVNVYHLRTEIAADAVSMIFIGWAIGAPIFGWVSDKMRRRKPIIAGSAILSLFFISCVLYMHMPVWLLFVLLFLYGVSNIGVATCYAVASELNPKPVAGTSVAFANMASVLIGALFQPVIGHFLDVQWAGAMKEGVPLYSASNYKHAMLVLPTFCIISLIFAVLTKETRAELCAEL